MLPGPDILPGQSGSSPSPHPVQIRLPEVPLDRAARLRGSALAHQRTGRADAPGTEIIHGLSLQVVPSRCKHLSCRAKADRARVRIRSNSACLRCRLIERPAFEVVHWLISEQAEQVPRAHR